MLINGASCKWLTIFLYGEWGKAASDIMEASLYGVAEGWEIYSLRSDVARKNNQSGL